MGRTLEAIRCEEIEPSDPRFTKSLDRSADRSGEREVIADFQLPIVDFESRRPVNSDVRWLAGA